MPYATPNPSSAPPEDRRKLSISGGRTRSHTLAPNAARTPDSCCRAAARASARFARFKQAISSTAPTSPSNAHNEGEKCCRREETPVTAEDKWIRRAKNRVRRSPSYPGGLVASRICGQSVSRLARAPVRVTSGRSRPYTRSHSTRPSRGLRGPSRFVANKGTVTSVDWSIIRPEKPSGSTPITVNGSFSI